MFCPMCGRDNSIERRFCAFCGTYMRGTLKGRQVHAVEGACHLSPFRNRDVPARPNARINGAGSICELIQPERESA
jgi:hypothetical protein